MSSAAIVATPFAGFFLGEERGFFLSSCPLDVHVSCYKVEQDEMQFYMLSSSV